RPSQETVSAGAGRPRRLQSIRPYSQCGEGGASQSLRTLLPRIAGRNPPAGSAELIAVDESGVDLVQTRRGRQPQLRARLLAIRPEHPFDRIRNSVRPGRSFEQGTADIGGWGLVEKSAAQQPRAGPTLWRR